MDYVTKSCQSESKVICTKAIRDVLSYGAECCIAGQRGWKITNNGNPTTLTGWSSRRVPGVGRLIYILEQNDDRLYLYRQDGINFFLQF